MFAFEPDLRSLCKGEITQQEFIAQTWSEVDCTDNSYISELHDALQVSYCDNDEIATLYTLRAESFKNKIFMFCCRDKDDLEHDSWVGIFMMLSDNIENKVQLLWCSGTE